MVRRVWGHVTTLLDEQGNLFLCERGRAAHVLSPEETFDPLDCLYAHRDLLGDFRE